MIFAFYEFVCCIPEFFFGTYVCSLLAFNSSFVAYKNKFSKEYSWVCINYYNCLFCFILFGLLLVNGGCKPLVLFSGLVCFDFVSQFCKVCLVFLTFFIFIFCKKDFFTKGLFSFEFFLILLLSLFGMCVMLSSNDLVFFYLGLELQSLAFYSLAAFNKSSAFSTEAGIKYFILGALASGFFLFGSALVYGCLGTTNYCMFNLLDQIGFFGNSFLLIVGLVFIITSFFFKLGVAPWHSWMPDIYEGSVLSVSIFFATLSKLVLVTCLTRLFFGNFLSQFFVLGGFFLVAGFLSLAFGTFGASKQVKFKRFFAYSAIVHSGFILLGLCTGSLLGLQASFFYILVYSVSSLLGWSFLLFFQSKFNFSFYLDQVEVFAKENFFLFFCFVSIIFSIAGIPPFIGFFAKFNIFVALADIHAVFFSVLALFFAALGAFYYLKIIKISSFFIGKSRDLVRSDYLFSSVLDKVNSFCFALLFCFFLFGSINSSLLFLLSTGYSLFIIG